MILNPNWYFKGQAFHWKLLRSLNLLEVDRPVVSFTKTYAWLSVNAFLVTTVMFMTTADSTALLAMAGTGLNNVLAVANYELKRQKTLSFLLKNGSQGEEGK